MPIELICVDKVLPHRNLTFEMLPVVIGRSASADIQLHDQFASRMHCEVFRMGDTLYVRDLDSGNGTYVNSNRVDESFLNPGDRLSVGSSTFKVSFSKRALTRGSASKAELVSRE